MKGHLDITGDLIEPEDEHEYWLYHSLYKDLQHVASTLPGWLYDAVGLGVMADKVDEAVAHALAKDLRRSAYEAEKLAERIEEED